MHTRVDTLCQVESEAVETYRAPACRFCGSCRVIYVEAGSVTWAVDHAHIAPREAVGAWCCSVCAHRHAFDIAPPAVVVAL